MPERKQWPGVGSPLGKYGWSTEPPPQELRGERLFPCRVSERSGVRIGSRLQTWMWPEMEALKTKAQSQLRGALTGRGGGMVPSVSELPGVPSAGKRELFSVLYSESSEENDPECVDYCYLLTILL